LQQLPPPRVTPPEESVYEGHDIYFFDDLDALPRFWVGMNRENVGELLIEFFRFFSSSFRYTHDVISVRTPGGLLSKESKGWMHDIIEESKDGRGGFLKIDLNRLCIEVGLPPLDHPQFRRLLPEVVMLIHGSSS
jgi:terminal uridylyltransferase